MENKMRNLVLSALLLASASSGLAAHEIKSDVKPGAEPAFDVTRAAAVTDGATATFLMEVAGKAGSVIPKAVGALNGSKVNAYVWPTSLDPMAVGFAPKNGILALAVTAHPDFDDTPLQDENGDGDKANDGKSWHSHWVVLEKDVACGGGLKVRDITPGTDLMPKTAPGLPLALDSPGAVPSLDGSTVTLAVPLTAAEGVAFDGVTAELQVNSDGKAPLLCVTSVMDVASGDLSLPGKITRAK
jgi:hypothetical protein